MTLKDIFDQLAYGELRQVIMGNASMEMGEGIPTERRKALLLSVKLGLTELHKRFLLMEKRLTLTVVPGKQSYLIHKRFAAANTKSAEPVKYINDTADPFQDDFMKIERVYDSEGTELPINVLGNENSVRVTSSNSLVLPDGYDQATFDVVYRADHPEIKDYLAEAAPQLIEVNLPGSHLEALLYYVASRVTNPVGMVTEFHEGNNYAMKFEAACQQLTTLGFTTNVMEENTRLRDNGWV